MIIDCGQNESPQRVMLQAFLADDLRHRRTPTEPPWFVHVHVRPDPSTVFGTEVVTGYLVHVDDFDLSLQEWEPMAGEPYNELAPATSIDLDDIDTVVIP